MAMGRDEARVVLVELGRIRAFSDVQGRHVVRMDNSVAKRQDLAHRLRDAGCSVNLDGNDWHTAGDLTPPAPPGGGLPLGRKLPKSAQSNLPRLDATFYESRHGSGDIHVTNHGPGDVYELNVEAPDHAANLVRSRDDFPVSKLPVGKSIKLMLLRHMADGLGSHFSLTATGRTEDGTPISQELFVSL